VSGETWVAIAAALIALGALFYSWRSTRAAVRAADAAEKQTKIQEQLRIDAAQPYVWADLRIDDTSGTLVNLVVGNSGPTVAEKVRVNIDPALPSVGSLGERAKAAQRLVADGIESLPPGRVLMWPLGTAPELMNAKIPQAYKLTVTARGPFGPVPTLTYIVDMANWHGSLDRPSGNLHRVALAVNELTKVIRDRSE
jgi:hypothetical protein